MTGVSTTEDNSLDYIEIQVHGPIDMKNDIKEILIPSNISNLTSIEQTLKEREWTKKGNIKTIKNGLVYTRW